MLSSSVHLQDLRLCKTASTGCHARRSWLLQRQLRSWCRSTRRCRAQCVNWMTWPNCQGNMPQYLQRLLLISRARSWWWQSATSMCLAFLDLNHSGPALFFVIFFTLRLGFLDPAKVDHGLGQLVPNTRLQLLWTLWQCQVKFMFWFLA